MSFNPCLCMPLQKGTMILAVVDAVLSLLSLGLFVIALVAVTKDPNDELDETEERIAIGICIVLIILCILQILLAFRLYYGARSKNTPQCRTWLWITMIIFIINVINFIVNNSATEATGTSLAGALIDLVYKLYEMIVVWSFIKELQREVILGATVGYSNNTTTGHPLQQYPPPYNPSGQIYYTPHSQPPPPYPMQQMNVNGQAQPQPTTIHSAYPPTTHHVTIT